MFRRAAGVRGPRDALAIRAPLLHKARRPGLRPDPPKLAPRPVRNRRRLADFRPSGQGRGARTRDRLPRRQRSLATFRPGRVPAREAAPRALPDGGITPAPVADAVVRGVRGARARRPVRRVA